VCGTERACWTGEPVVLVVARTRAEAEDTAACVAIQRLELPVVADKKGALAPRTPPIHRQLTDNLAFRKIDTGDIEAVVARADRVIEGTFEFARHTAVRLEPRCVLADYEEATGKLTITTSSQCPHRIQRVFAATLGVPDHKVQIIAPDVGSFGLKIHTYGDELATCAAMRLGRPVKLVADRLEAFVSDIHTRENFVRARIAVSKAGDIEAFDVDVLSGAGAYAQYPRTSVLEGTQILNITGGPYKHKHYRGRASIVYLNEPPSSQYRAAGHPIGNALREHLVDRAAAALGIDAVEIVARNVIPDEGYPAIAPSGVTLKGLSHARCLDVLVERVG
jgi:aerobic carbon-monoxide dehydrogenase large subunit